MYKIYYIFMVLVACMNSDLHGMQKKKKKKVHYDQQSQISNHEEVSAKATFGYFGAIAVGELYIKDKEKKIAQLEAIFALKSLMYKADNDDDYERINKKAKEIVALDIGTLCFVFSDVAYKEYVRNIKGVCKSIIQLSKKKNYKPKQAQDFFAQTNVELNEFFALRQDLKQFLLETHVSNLIANDQEEIRFNFWHEDFEVTTKKVANVVVEHCFCIEHMEVDSVKKTSQGSFVDFCYWFSEYAWIHNKKLEAIKYCNRACQKKADWNVEGLVSSRVLLNWLELMNGIEHKESTQPIFRKRRLPKPKPFEKKQKMFTE